MLVQGEDVSSAFDGMRNVKPVEADEDENPITELSTEEVASIDDKLQDNAALPSLSARDFDVFPPSIGFEREEGISDIGAAGELIIFRGPFCIPSVGSPVRNAPFPYIRELIDTWLKTDEKRPQFIHISKIIGSVFEESTTHLCLSFRHWIKAFQAGMHHVQSVF